MLDCDYFLPVPHKYKHVCATPLQAANTRKWARSCSVGKTCWNLSGVTLSCWFKPSLINLHPIPQNNKLRTEFLGCANVFTVLKPFTSLLELLWHWWHASGFLDPVWCSWIWGYSDILQNSADPLKLRQAGQGAAADIFKASQPLLCCQGRVLRAVVLLEGEPSSEPLSSLDQLFISCISGLSTAPSPCPGSRKTTTPVGDEWFPPNRMNLTLELRPHSSILASSDRRILFYRRVFRCSLQTKDGLSCAQIAQPALIKVLAVRNFLCFRIMVAPVLIETFNAAFLRLVPRYDSVSERWRQFFCTSRVFPNLNLSGQDWGVETILKNLRALSLDWWRNAWLKKNLQHNKIEKEWKGLKSFWLH